MAEQTRPNPSVPDLPEQVSIERVTEYDVYDANGEHVGSTTAIWMDRHNQPAFIGVKTTWLLGKTHVIPAWGAEVNHQAKRIRIPCPEEVIKDAPTFSPDEELDEAKEQEIMTYFRTRGACQPRAAASTAPQTGVAREPEARRVTAEETVIPLHEEQVNIGKRSVETGGVRLRKVVRTETVQQPVELKREEIHVERVPATGRATTEGAFQGQDIYIPLRHEEPVVEKQTNVREEVRVRKTAETEQRNVAGQVRKEDIQVEKDQDKRRAA